MAKSLRLSEKWFQRALWLISGLFAIFLIGLGSLIVRDLPKVEAPLSEDMFLNQKIVRPLKQRIKTLETESMSLDDAIETQRLLFSYAQKDTTQARDSFRTWATTRQVTKRGDKDTEVLKRSTDLDKMSAKERAAQKKLEPLEKRALEVNQELQSARSELNKHEQDAYEQRANAQRRQDIKVFGIRLLFTLPLILLAGWLLLKKRSSVYWPFVWGFNFFALFTFFVELVPYLPSYGGYVRYGVGIVLTFLIGHYAIRALQRYLAQQALAEQQSEVQRRETLDYDLANNRIKQSVCPGCERPLNLADANVNFCPHCGICVFNHCRVCNTRKNVFSRFCFSCGTVGQTNEEPAPLLTK